MEDPRDLNQRDLLFLSLPGTNEQIFLIFINRKPRERSVSGDCLIKRTVKTAKALSWVKTAASAWRVPSLL
jgi:hypothetical protein